MNESNTQQPRELELLKERLVGNWKVDLTVRMPDGTVVSGSGTLKAEAIALGYGVHTVLDSEITGMGKYAEMDLLSYDRWERKVHL